MENMKVDFGMPVTQQQSGNKTSILEDPEAVSEGKGKSKRREKNRQRKVVEKVTSHGRVTGYGSCARARSNAPISVKPEGGGGGGVGHRVGILTFSKKNYQNPHPRAKKNCQN